MSNKFVSYLGWIWFTCTISCLILEGAAFASREMTIINALSSTFTLNLFGVWEITLPNLLFITVGFVRLLLWDYSFLTGGIGWLIRLGCIAVLNPAGLWGLYQVAVGVISYTRR